MLLFRSSSKPCGRSFSSEKTFSVLQSYANLPLSDIKAPCSNTVEKNMRLLNTASLKAEDFFLDDIPTYAILSHRWRKQEVSLQELNDGRAVEKDGYVKLVQCCRIALAAGFNYVWIDTCCIDKTNNTELTEAINSMYRWYKDSQTCYAYLDDVTTEGDFDQSEWFIRGWTLHELIAPVHVEFCNKSWKHLETKRSLRKRVRAATGIHISALSGSPPASFSIAQRMSWASRRVTTKIEDTAYCLFGLFDVNMPLLYGEGQKSFLRLQQEIIKDSSDQSIFAWSSNAEGYRGLLALSPSCLSGSSNIVSCDEEPFSTLECDIPYSMTNKGLAIRLPFLVKPRAVDTHVALVRCLDTSKPAPGPYIGIFLTSTKLARARCFARVSIERQDIIHVDSRLDNMVACQVDAFIPQHERGMEHYIQKRHGFRFWANMGDANQHGDYDIHTRYENFTVERGDAMLILPPGDHRKRCEHQIQASFFAY